MVFKQKYVVHIIEIFCIKGTQPCDSLVISNNISWGCVHFIKNKQINYSVGSGCGAVGRAVAYDMRGHGFESSHRQLLLNIYLLLTVCRKDENKEKRPGMAHFLKKQINYLCSWGIGSSSAYFIGLASRTYLECK